MLKITVYALILLNIGLWVFSHHAIPFSLLGRKSDATFDAEYHPEALTLLTQEAAITLNPSTINLPKKVNEDPLLACWQWGPFFLKEEDKVIAQLKQTTWGRRLVREVIKDTTLNRVFIPPFQTESAAKKALKQLSTLGIQDAFIIKGHSNLKWAISLGVFQSRIAAEKYWAKTKKEGVEHAQITVETTPKTQVIYQFKSLLSSEKDTLEKIRDHLPHVSAVSCDDTHAPSPTKRPATSRVISS